ncbi:KH domain-containing protein [Candidatus Daviesbacteria bacterium]|nr:KH domain-containing protein [Candidatus Daviesbacteria bacterium]
MEDKLNQVLDNILGFLLLEGSYELEEKEESFLVSIDTKDAGRLIGARGESLDSLQLLVNQIMGRLTGTEGFKRVVLDVSGWKKNKEEELVESAKQWGKQVLETGKELELEPQSAWQRRIVHMVISEMDGLSSESAGEGRDRHIVIKPGNQKTNKPTQSEQKDSENSENQQA